MSSSSSSRRIRAWAFSFVNVARTHNTHKQKRRTLMNGYYVSGRTGTVLSNNAKTSLLCDYCVTSSEQRGNVHSLFRVSRGGIKWVIIRILDKRYDFWIIMFDTKIILKTMKNSKPYMNTIYPLIYKKPCVSWIK